MQLMAVPESLDTDGLHYEYEASLSCMADGSWRLEGQWRSVTAAEVAAAVEEAQAVAAREGAENADSVPEPRSESVVEWEGVFACERIVAGAGDGDSPVGLGGLFMGEAVPAQGLEHSVPRNPIKCAETDCFCTFFLRLLITNIFVLATGGFSLPQSQKTLAIVRLSGPAFSTIVATSQALRCCGFTSKANSTAATTASASPKSTNGKLAGERDAHNQSYPL